jgi:signal transduction histidine kinase
MPFRSDHHKKQSRLSRRIYLSFIGVILLFALLAGVLRVTTERWHHQHVIGTLEMASQTLPTADADPLQMQRWVDQLSQQLAWDLAVTDRSGHTIAATGRLVNRQLPRFSDQPVRRVRGLGPIVQRTLADGRTITGRLPPPRRSGWYSWLLLLVVAVTLGAHPLSRRITRRLERLQAGVEAVGTGAPGARVAVEGSDEIAQLARSFNDTFSTLQQLLEQRTLMLATASHELRTPLTRLRMAIELLSDNPRQDLQQQIQRDITELDTLVGELLLASRLEVGNNAQRFEHFDLLALAAETAGQYGLEIGGETVNMQGDRQALGVLISNLISNALRYGGGQIDITVSAISPHTAQITVTDNGPGTPESEREKIFEPFYRSKNSAPGGTATKDRGIGLGLYLVRQIARHHGGDAICTAAKTGGCCFEITLKR